MFGRAAPDGEPQNAATIQHRTREKHLSSGICRLDQLIGELVAFFWARTLDAQAEQVQRVGGDNFKAWVSSHECRQFLGNCNMSSNEFLEYGSAVGTNCEPQLE